MPDSLLIEPLDVMAAGGMTSNVAETLAVYAGPTAYAQGDQVRHSDHYVYESLTGAAHTVTLNASTDVVNLAAHGLPAGTQIALRSTGTLPEAFAANTIYHLVNPADDTFQLAATPGGAAILFTGSGSGTITAIVAPNKGNALTDAGQWLKLRPTNPWAMFDQLRGTVTSNALSIETTVDVAGRADSVALLGLAGAIALQVTITADAAEVFDATFSLLDDDVVDDLWTYFYEELEYRTDIVLVDLPNYADPSFAIALSGPATVSCGSQIIGQLRYIGEAEFGMKSRMLSLSRVQRDQFGVYYIVKRGSVKEMTVPMSLYRGQAARVRRLYERLLDTPIVFMGSDRDEPFIDFGYWTEFELTLPNARFATYTLNFKGLT